MVDSYITSLFSLAEHCEYESLHDEMTRDRIVVGIIGCSLSLKLDSTLTLKKATDAVCQSEAKTVDFVKAKRQPKYYPTKSMISAKPQSTNRKCNFCGRSHVHKRAMCPAREATCFNCRKVGHFGVVCRSTRSVDAMLKKPDPEVAFPGT